MSVAEPPLVPEVKVRTFADLLEELGGIAPSRIIMDPPPGAATEADVVRLHDHADRTCELIDGTLVEKAMGVREAFLAAALIGVLRGFVRPRKLGIVLGPDGAVRLWAGRVESVSNTAAELERKRADYFRSDVRLVWQFDPRARTVAVYTSPDNPTVLRVTDVLDGGPVLPGFTLPLSEVFAELDEQG
jgi:hypothetical protein